jgi:hypothetical protein
MLRPRPVRIVDRATGDKVDGIIRLATLGDKVLWSRWHSWMPAEAEDAHWQWDTFIDVSLAFPTLAPVFSLEASGELQGVMLLEVALPTRESLGFHVDRLSTAPWNRPPQSRYRGVGSVFLGDAILRHLAADFDGRVYLSSLPAAEGFYRRLGMTEFGERDPEGLRQFAFEPDAGWAHIYALGQDGQIDAES